jgi:hypothetical protein
MRIREHRHNLKEGRLDRSKLAQHAFEGHRTGWGEACVLEIESNSRYRKYKESAHMACLTNPISEPSLDISALWIPLLAKRLVSQKGSLYDIIVSLPISAEFISRVLVLFHI